MACHHGPVRSYRHGNNDHPDGSVGRTDVADCYFGDGGHGTATRNSHDGGCDGRFGELHESDFASGEHPRNGPRWLSIRRLPQSRRAIDDRSFRHGHGLVAKIVAIAGRRPVMGQVL